MKPCQHISYVENTDTGRLIKTCSSCGVELGTCVHANAAERILDRANTKLR